MSLAIRPLGTKYELFLVECMCVPQVELQLLCISASHQWLGRAT